MQVRVTGVMVEGDKILLLNQDTDSDRSWSLPGGKVEEAYLAARIAHCFRELRDDDRTRDYADQSLQMCDGYERGKAFNLCVLATAYVRSDPRHAVIVGGQAADIVETLASRRSHSYRQAVSLRHAVRGRRLPGPSPLAHETSVSAR